jgi:hypothetical protein
MTKRSIGLTVAQMLLFTMFAPLLCAEATVCEILARNLKPDTLLQGSNSERFNQVKRLLSDNTYEEFKNASSSSLDGTLLSEYVDIFLKTSSNDNSWKLHREQFLNMSSETAFASDANSLQISRINTAALREIVKCQEAYANQKGFSATLVTVSDRRDSFAVLITNRTGGDPNWKLTSFSPKPEDTKFQCNNGYEHASVVKPMKLTTNSVLITCSKSPETHVLLGVQTTAGPAESAFTLDSVHEEIKQIMEDTAAKIQALTDRLDKRGEVVAFDATSCPPPWTAYTPAVGRFVRGYDPGGTNDPGGKERQIGSLQGDGVGAHTHTMGVNGVDSSTILPGNGRRLANFIPGIGTDPKMQTDQNTTDPTTNSTGETRPKNVSLLYCILN